MESIYEYINKSIKVNGMLKDFEVWNIKYSVPLFFLPEI